MNKKSEITSWALYDLANTIFATNIVSLYFPLWVIIDRGAADKFYILPYYFSMVLAMFIFPFLGILSDSLKRYALFLNIFTIGCIVCTALIGLSGNLFIGILFFAFANLFNQASANIFYPALLTRVASRDKIPLVSGLGVGLGYVGTIIGVFSVKFFIRDLGYRGVFLPTAILFLLFSLPSFFFVKDEKVNNIDSNYLQSAINSYLQKLIGTFRIIGNNKALLRFFCAILFVINGVNGVLLNIGAYGRRVIGFSDSELPVFIAISTVFAFFSAFVFGFVIKKLGEKRTFSLVLMGWVFILTAVAFCHRKDLCWLFGPAGGILLAGTWVTLRPLIIKVASPDRIGEFFGLTALASVLGSLFSPLLWLVTIAIFEPLGLVKYRIALFMLAFLVFIGFILLQKIPDKKLIE